MRRLPDQARFPYPGLPDYGDHMAAAKICDVKPRGAVPIKGLAEPIEVFELVGAGTARSRLEATPRRGLARFVGRNFEMQQLRDALDQATLRERRGGRVARIALRYARLRAALLQRCGVQCAPSVLEQALVGYLVRERVLERVLEVGEEANLVKKLRAL